MDNIKNGSIDIDVEIMINIIKCLMQEKKIDEGFKEIFEKAENILIEGKKEKKVNYISNPFDEKELFEMIKLEDVINSKEITFKVKDRKSVKNKHKRILTEIEKYDNFSELLNVLENKYSYVSVYKSLPSTSLFEISKLLFALIKILKDKENKQIQFKLVNGGITGVQKFIYTVPNKGCLKTLRARSFYLEFIISHSINEVLKRMGSNSCNILFIGGSNFMFFVEDTKNNERILEEFKLQVNKWLIKHFNLSIYLEMETEIFKEIGKKENKDNMGIEDAKRRIDSKLKENKNSKYREVELKYILEKEEENHTGTTEQCTSCKVSKDYKVVIKRENDIGYMCDDCFSLYKLGEKLSTQTRNTLSVYTTSKEEKEIEIPYIGEGTKYSYIRFDDNKIKTGNNDVLKYNINKWSGTNKNISIASYQNVEEGKIIHNSIDDIVNSDNRISILRADVDDLSEYFKNKDFFVKNAISKQLTIFFKLYIQNLCMSLSEDKNESVLDKLGESKENTVPLIIYAGGDDIFIIGSTKDIIKMSILLNEEFKKFTNKKLKISSGIGIFKPNLPVSKAGEMTGEIEAVAKKGDKNKVALFNALDIEHCYKWNDFKDVIAKVEYICEKLKITDNLDEEELKKGNTFIHNIYSFIENDIKYNKILYTLGALKEGAKEDEENILEFSESFLKWIDNKEEKRKLKTGLLLIMILNKRNGGEKNNVQ